MNQIETVANVTREFYEFSAERGEEESGGGGSNKTNDAASKQRSARIENGCACRFQAGVTAEGQRHAKEEYCREAQDVRHAFQMPGQIASGHYGDGRPQSQSVESKPRKIRIEESVLESVVPERRFDETNQ